MCFQMNCQAKNSKCVNKFLQLHIFIDSRIQRASSDSGAGMSREDRLDDEKSMKNMNKGLTGVA